MSDIPARVEALEDAVEALQSKIGGGPGRGSDWKDRLAPLMDEPGTVKLFRMGSPASARQTAYALSQGLNGIPPGTWDFSATGLFVRAEYLGPES